MELCTDLLQSFIYVDILRDLKDRPRNLKNFKISDEHIQKTKDMTILKTGIVKLYRQESVW